MWNNIVKSVKSIAIVGDTRTGKTALGYLILKGFKKPVYLFRHPKPQEIESLGFNNLQKLGEIEHLNNCVIWIDEPQLYITLYDSLFSFVIYL